MTHNTQPNTETRIGKLVRTDGIRAVANDCTPDEIDGKYEIFNSRKDWSYLAPGMSSTSTVAACLCTEGIEDVIYAIDENGERVYIDHDDIDQACDILDEYIGFERPNNVMETMI